MKFILEIEERIKLNHKLVVEANSEGELESILDRIETDDLDILEDYEYELTKNGIKIAEEVKDGSGEATLECTDCYAKDDE